MNDERKIEHHVLDSKTSKIIHDLMKVKPEQFSTKEKMLDYFSSLNSKLFSAFPKKLMQEEKAAPHTNSEQVNHIERAKSFVREIIEETERLASEKIGKPILRDYTRPAEKTAATLKNNGEIKRFLLLRDSTRPAVETVVVSKNNGDMFVVIWRNNEVSERYLLDDLIKSNPEEFSTKEKTLAYLEKLSRPTPKSSTQEEKKGPYTTNLSQEFREKMVDLKSHQSSKPEPKPKSSPKVDLPTKKL